MSRAPWRGAARSIKAAFQKVKMLDLRLAWLAAALVLLLSPQITQAHALLVRADPQPNAELAQPPAAIQFWFSEPLEATFTGARILTAGGTEIPTAAPRIDPADSTHLTLPLESIEPGIYTVVWQTLSSVDGHEWVGSFPLTILNPDGTRPAGSAVEVTVHHQDGLPPLADSLLRWLSLLSAALLVGPLSIRWLLAGAAARENDEFSLIVGRLSQSIALAGAIGLSAGGWLQLLVQALRLGEIGEFPELLLATRPGNLLLMRQALLAAVILLIIRNRLAAVISPLSSGGASSPSTLSGRMRRAAPHVFWLYLGLCVLGLGGTLFYHLNLWILAVAIVVATSILSDLLVRREQTWARVFPKQARATLLTTAALFTFATSSHAAAARGSGWAVAADFAHLVAAAVWAGGLIFLALLLLQLHRLQTVPSPSGLIRLLRRFSLSAQVAVFVLALTGLFSSFVQLPGIDSLFSTTYGQVLLIKLVTVAAILALAFLNNRAVQQAEDTVTRQPKLRHFSRRVAVEAGMAVILFISVAVLVQTPTPKLPLPTTPVAPSLPFNKMAYDSDLAIHLQVTPNQVGHNRYWVHLSHPDSSDIGEVQLVRLFFNHESGQMGQARLDLADLGEDAFGAEGAFLNRDGEWNLSVYVRRRGMNDVLAEISVQVPSPENVQLITRSPWRNPIPRLPAQMLVGALLIALSLVPLLWRRPLLRVSRPLYIVLAMAALFFFLSGALLGLTAFSQLNDPALPAALRHPPISSSPAQQ